MRLVLCCLVLWLGGLQLTSAQPPPLRVGAWNIQRFGPTKANDPIVMGHIYTVVQRYDIIVIQELQDNNQFVVVNTLMNLLNQLGPAYASIVSARLGPGNYKEQYLYVYRTNRVALVRTDQYPLNYAIFRRPPLVAEFRDNAVGGVGNFVLIPQHTAPMRAACKEIDALVDVVAYVSNGAGWGIQNMLILGDFNAAGTYTTAVDWPYIRLSTNPYFHWLITNADDTTVARGGHAYDRIVATNPMIAHVVAGSAQVHNFQNAQGITQNDALAVSDHFPVEVELQ